MTGITEYIESYFQQTLSTEERTAFEARCETDEAFAKEIAFYIATRQALREELLAQKQQQWKQQDVESEEAAPIISISKKSTFIRWISYAAAACLLIVASVFLFEVQRSPQKLAANYVENYDDLGTTMDGSHDSLQIGIAAYKNKDYNRALQLFEWVEKHEPLNSDAKRNAGLAYLQLKNYDKAIQQFDELANMQGLFSNPGDFWKATALLERNNPGDKEAAKVLLQKVVNEKEEGSEKAEEWLNKLN
jgi:tetratricopeptide (TPR) repeat protein